MKNHKKNKLFGPQEWGSQWGSQGAGFGGFRVASGARKYDSRKGLRGGSQTGFWPRRGWCR